MHAVVELSWEVRVQTFLRTKPYGYSMHNKVGTCEEILPRINLVGRNLPQICCSALKAVFQNLFENLFGWSWFE